MKSKFNYPDIEDQIPQFGVRFFCTDGTSYREEFCFPDYDLAASFAEVEMELANCLPSGSDSPCKLILRFEIFPEVVVLKH
ncbi:MAG: hypothetical protein J5J00_15320 [Deltaproteobacteria bacterium]|nr:hypothetical protein [Deltaproteobacteria bacterium]